MPWPVFVPEGDKTRNGGGLDTPTRRRYRATADLARSAAPRGDEGTRMAGETATWEYRALAADDPALDLDALGRAGWELVGAVEVRGRPTLYLKRPGPGLRERVTLDQRAAVYAARGLALPEEGAEA
jgi:hypothetical protein